VAAPSPPKPRVPLPSLPLFAAVSEHAEVKALMAASDEVLARIGYTEHGARHCGLVAKAAFRILDELGYVARSAELAAVAGYLHDLGNAIGRKNHPLASAMLAREILRELGVPPAEVALVMGAIAAHGQNPGEIPSEVAAAVVIADKADVHRTRVRDASQLATDIHDRVNWSVTRSVLLVDAGSRTVLLDLDLDPATGDVVEYFQAFLDRMVLCRDSASVLRSTFRLRMNGTSFA
jgi:metal-dependent HD superfamily phosphatase/phosphodiesterase